ncbi:MAG: cupredoxin domain-containing protein [Chloroflexota bacterium]
MLEQPVHARIDPDGRQVIDIVIDGGYHPGAIVARAGLSLRLVFTRDDDDDCSERVVFSDPRLDRRIAPTGRTSIDLPARPPGEVRFTCGMGRYRGRIELVDEGTRSRATRLRDRLGRLATPLGTALLLWISTLPLVVLVGLIASDVTITIVAAVSVLVAWVAGCLCAVGRSAGPT